MRILSTFLVFVLVAFLGCNEIISPSSPDGLWTQPSAVGQGKWSNNPNNGNLRIFRNEIMWAGSWTDPKNSLRATHTTRPIGTETDCGLLEAIDPIEHQDVGIFNEEDPFSSWLHHVIKGELWVIVRDTSQPGDCFGNKLIAQGWGKLHTNDNSVFGIVGDHQFANTWGFTGHGDLETPGGELLRYNGRLHFIYAEPGSDGDFFFRVTKAKVGLN